MPRYLFQSKTDTDTPPLGGKARALLDLERLGFSQIPSWFAVLPSARLKNRQIAAAALVEIENTLRTFPKNTLFAVRSSAPDEDGAEHSFAGQLDSFLNVPARHLTNRIQRVWASGFSPRMTAYRRKHNLPRATTPPVVLIQQMVEADISGVAFGADPVSGHRGVAVISGLWGLGTALVGGEADADTWLVHRDDLILERRIVPKTFVHAPANPRSQRTEGFRKANVSKEKIHLPCLSDSQILAVAHLVRQTTQAFGRPQDIEWAIADGQLFLLQSRPITNLANLPDPDGSLQIWDNSNIAESYNGISSPLTFSFARRVYEEVYRQFCRILSVPETRIVENADTFRRMLGHIRGRIYYNLVSWYRVLALLPGFQINRSFMEQMMGVKEGLPPEILADITKNQTPHPWLDGWHLFQSTLSLVRSHFRLPSDIRRFYTRLDTALSTPIPPLAQQRPDELATHYRQLETQLLTRWDAPLVNDFFAMIFHGVLKKLTARWCADESGALANTLISAQGNIISAEPALRLRTLASLAVANPAFVQLLQTASLADILRDLPAHPEFQQAYQAYLDKFAGRCLEELKLETETLDDNPLPLLRSIGRLANAAPLSRRGGVLAADPTPMASPPSLPLPRRLLFAWVLRNTRQRVSDRENLRFERTRVFGRVRQIFQEIGRRLHASQSLENPRDIFYLGVEEILGFIDGTALTTDLRALVTLRKIEEEKYRTQPAPAGRFETRGSVHLAHNFTSQNLPTPSPEGDTLSGLGCSPGLISGRARVILDPRNAIIEPGEILVAPRTDPGWILLFPSAAGLLVEFGSLLSHSAIVSRELDLPAIVSIAGLTSWVKTGDLIEMNGSTGVVRKLPPP